jgi:HemY protein
VRFAFWGVVALILGTLGAHFLVQDRGYVLIDFRGYVIEMSVPALVLLLVAAYALVRFGIALWRAPRRLGAAVAERRARSAGDKLTRGLIHLSQGHWARGERLLTRSIHGSEAPLPHYLMAARAAQQQGSIERRNEWLKLAFEALPDAEAAILLTQAELQSANGEQEGALATLRRITEKQPDNPVAVGLLAKTYRNLGDDRGLLELLPHLSSADLATAEKAALIVTALETASASGDFDAAKLAACWTQVAGEWRQVPAVIAWRAHALDQLGKGDQAEGELRKALKREWHPELVRAYGDITGSDKRKQLKQAESWLKDHADDGVLLLCAARLCLANELWGKARSYLESSIAIAPDAGSFALYGKLLAQLGEVEGAAAAYKRGLGLVSAVDFDLPALDAPPAGAAVAAAGD